MLSSCTFCIVQCDELNMTLLPLSQSWDILKRFNFNLSTSYTFAKDLEGLLPILPIPTTLPTSSSLKVTLPYLFFLILLKSDAFPLMCHEQALSRYQSSSLAFKHTCKTIDQAFLALTLNLGPM